MSMGSVVALQTAAGLDHLQLEPRNLRCIGHSGQLGLQSDERLPLSGERPQQQQRHYHTSESAQHDRPCA